MEFPFLYDLIEFKKKIVVALLLHTALQILKYQ